MVWAVENAATNPVMGDLSVSTERPDLAGVESHGFGKFFFGEGVAFTHRGLPPVTDRVNFGLSWCG